MHHRDRGGGVTDATPRVGLTSLDTVCPYLGTGRESPSHTSFPTETETVSFVSWHPPLPQIEIEILD